MTETEDQKVLKIAFQVALQARQETFIAHYPRKLKLAVLLIPFLALVLFSFMGKKEPVVSHQEAPSSSLEQQMAHGHDAPLPALEDHQEVVSKESAHSRYARKRTDPLTEAEKEAIKRNDNYESKVGMVAAPNSAFVEERSSGNLPKIARDGRKPWEIYARPFDLLDPRPRIALVMADLGLSRIATDSAIYRLPPPVTLVFDVQGTAIKDWLERARSDGHETLLSLPMEPVDYPRNDPGPGTLLMSLSNSENVERLLSFLGVGSGYVGVTSLMGARFLGDVQKVNPVLDEISARGLIFLDSEVSQHSVLAGVAKEKKIPYFVNSMILDETLTPQAIDAALARIEKIAQIRGSVVALASPLPLTLERLNIWFKGLSDRGFVLAPLSAVVIQ